ncbi:hypothetical protein [Hydrogenivirga sp. 128-5-R1-1]|uniref:hypothetical protein n=1 Tax=Hydrogenivirga sp. 128-5-R1-1 TaxID=392423 RepID=UPI00015F1560|nr:hypothetical protein [Hydrogenivirga sp. 128-5-R1-1]EDP74782.1 hypothetical protein HG1285_08829 [Hydrogenivirga sp. 128-5-R1-1]
MLDKSELDEELLREIAGIGGGYGEKIERCMGEMERIVRAVGYLRKRIERSRGTPKLSIRLSVRLRKRFWELREEALRQRRFLIIYREALGLLKHREVFEIYNVERFTL